MHGRNDKMSKRRKYAEDVITRAYNKLMKRKEQLITVTLKSCDMIYV